LSERASFFRLCFVGAVTVIATDQNKATIARKEIGKRWQNSNITTEHCP
jgi:hypothetical protein